MYIYPATLCSTRNIEGVMKTNRREHVCVCESKKEETRERTVVDNRGVNV